MGESLHFQIQLVSNSDPVQVMFVDDAGTLSAE